MLILAEATRVQIFVWKQLDYGAMTEKEKHMPVSEVNILRELRHPNIVKYYDRFVVKTLDSPSGMRCALKRCAPGRCSIIDRENTTIYIIMEFCEGGDLAELIKARRRSRRVRPNRV